MDPASILLILQPQKINKFNVDFEKDTQITDVLYADVCTLGEFWREESVSWLWDEIILECLDIILSFAES